MADPKEGERVTAYTERLIQERDEARAEVERIKANHVTVAEEVQRRHDACAPLTAEIERLRGAARKAVSSLGDPYHERAIELLASVLDSPAS